MPRVKVPLKQIPQTVLDEVLDQLGHYLVPLLAFSPDEEEEPLKIVGSGTLVAVGEMNCILTAAHVWDIIKNSEQMMIILAKYQSRLCIPTRELQTREIRNFGSEQWGPDLALIPLSNMDAATIGAKKSFLNLARQMSSKRTRPVAGCVCAALGMIGGLSSLTKDYTTRMANAHVQIRAFVGAVERRYKRGDWDYLDIGSQLDSPGVPGSFGGLSGGGLWELHLTFSKSTQTITWDRNRTLIGVAFWQSEVRERHRVVRCHGVDSLYSTAWRRWALPN